MGCRFLEGSKHQATHLKKVLRSSAAQWCLQPSASVLSGQPVPNPEVILRIRRKLPRAWTFAAHPKPLGMPRGLPPSYPYSHFPKCGGGEDSDLLLQVQGYGWLLVLMILCESDSPDACRGESNGLGHCSSICQKRLGSIQGLVFAAVPPNDSLKTGVEAKRN